MVTVDPESFTEANVVHAQVLVARAQIALGKYKDLQASLAGVTADEVELTAVKLFAQYSQGQQKKQALEKMEALAAEHKENHTVEYLVGAVLVLEERLDEALELLSLHQGSLEAWVLVLWVCEIFG